MYMNPRPYVLQETNWKTVKETTYNVAVLPWGATEAHNYHLPYGTDNIQNEFIAAEAAKLAWDRGAKVVVLPNVPFGANCQQLDIKAYHQSKSFNAIHHTERHRQCIGWPGC
jgi:creatinine amidohydrolase